VKALADATVLTRRWRNMVCGSSCDLNAHHRACGLRCSIAKWVVQLYCKKLSRSRA